MTKIYRRATAFLVALALTLTVVLSGPAHAASTSLTANAETGDTSAFAVTSGTSATATSAGHYHGAYGYHLSANSSPAYLEWNTTQVEQNHAYFSVSFWVKIDAQHAAPQTVDLVSIKNVAGVNNFDLFFKADGHFAWDLLSTNNATSLTTFSLNTWHLVEAKGYYGDAGGTYTADVRIDGVNQPSISSIMQTPSTVKTAWFGTSTSTKTFETDYDDIALNVGDSDAGFNGNPATSPFGATGCNS